MVNSAECFVSLQGGRTRLKPATASDDNAADGKTGSASCLKYQPDTTQVYQQISTQVIKTTKLIKKRKQRNGKEKSLFRYKTSG